MASQNAWIGAGDRGHLDGVEARDVPIGVHMELQYPTSQEPEAEGASMMMGHAVSNRRHRDTDTPLLPA